MARSKLSLTSWTTCAKQNRFAETNEKQKGRPGLKGKRETDQANDGEADKKSDKGAEIQV